MPIPRLLLVALLAWPALAAAQTPAPREFAFLANELTFTSRSLMTRSYARWGEAIPDDVTATEIEVADRDALGVEGIDQDEQVLEGLEQPLGQQGADDPAAAYIRDQYAVPYRLYEQVHGRPVDARSDVFSFGVMLYEMLSGTRPFAGESKLDTATSILRDEPAPLADLARIDRAPTGQPPPPASGADGEADGIWSRMLQGWDGDGDAALTASEWRGRTPPDPGLRFSWFQRMVLPWSPSGSFWDWRF